MSDNTAQRVVSGQALIMLGLFVDSNKSGEQFLWERINKLPRTGSKELKPKTLTDMTLTLIKQRPETRPHDGKAEPFTFAEWTERYSLV